MGNAPAGHLSINEAADRLNVNRWEVVDLIEADQLESVTFVTAASLAKYQEAS